MILEKEAQVSKVVSRYVLGYEAIEDPYPILSPLCIY